MGDVILQTPWIAWLKNLYPKFTITFITLDIFSDFVKDHPFIDNVILIKRKRGKEDLKQLLKLSQDLKKNYSVDLIMDFHGTLRSGLLSFFCFSIPTLKIYKRSFQRWILVKFKWDQLKNLESHHSRLIIDFCFLFDEKAEINKLQDFLSSRAKVQNIGLTNISASFNNLESLKLDSCDFDYIVLSPVASFASKRWPMEKVKLLIADFLSQENFSHLNIVILGGKDDTYCGKEFSDSCIETERLINKQGQTSILETVAYIKKAKACITNDTGAAHIAESLGVPVVSLFGATSESFGFRMHLAQSINISIPLACRPCSQTGKKDCFQASHLCMEGIEVKTVLNSLRIILEKK